MDYFEEKQKDREEIEAAELEAQRIADVTRYNSGIYDGEKWVVRAYHVLVGYNVGLEFERADTFEEFREEILSIDRQLKLDRPITFQCITDTVCAVCNGEVCSHCADGRVEVWMAMAHTAHRKLEV